MILVSGFIILCYGYWSLRVRKRGFFEDGVIKYGSGWLSMEMGGNYRVICFNGVLKSMYVWWGLGFYFFKEVLGFVVLVEL